MLLKCWYVLIETEQTINEYFNLQPEKTNGQWHLEFEMKEMTKETVLLKTKMHFNYININSLYIYIYILKVFFSKLNLKWSQFFPHPTNISSIKQKMFLIKFP